tara:strand:+ start:299 stop:508 length:210 start_codon:yes stop_codon:yes gene_type:complete
MNAELKKPFDECSATRFRGGIERGTCIQLTKREKDYGLQHLTFTRQEAAQAAAALLNFSLGIEVDYDDE